MAVSTSVAGTTPIETAPVPSVRPARSGPVTALVLVVGALLGTAATTYLAVAGTSLGGTLDGLDLWFYENNPSLTPEALGWEAARSWSAAALALLAVAWLLT